jgi:hypothetical protein
MDDRALLRDLKTAIQQSDGQGADAQARAIFAVLAQHGATEADVRRLLGRARDRRRSELTSLQQHLDLLIEEREEAEATATAADRFLRDLRRLKDEPHD